MRSCFAASVAEEDCPRDWASKSDWEVSRFWFALVSSVAKESAAAKAGIKAGDYITHIDGEFLYGFSLDEAVDKMRGKPGTTVKLTIVRPGRDKPFDVSVTRERIELKPVKWEVKDNVGIININGFSANTGSLTREALVSIDKATGGKATGYIVDLRSNPGGLLDQAIEVSDAFLEQGEIVSERGREAGDIERFYAKPGDMAKGKPVIVLVDAGSASAAEIGGDAARHRPACDRDTAARQRRKSVADRAGRVVEYRRCGHAAAAGRAGLSGPRHELRACRNGKRGRHGRHRHLAPSPLPPWPDVLGTGPAGEVQPREAR